MLLLRCYYIKYTTLYRIIFMNHIKLENIYKNFGHIKALNGASITAYIGQKTAIVGDNGSGKSTLMNLLTQADVYVKNELFATLDPTARALDIDGAEFLLVDTVGF